MFSRDVAASVFAEEVSAATTNSYDSFNNFTRSMFIKKSQRKQPTVVSGLVMLQNLCLVGKSQQKQQMVVSCFGM